MFFEFHDIIFRVAVLNTLFFHRCFLGDGFLFIVIVLFLAKVVTPSAEACSWFCEL